MVNRPTAKIHDRSRNMTSDQAHPCLIMVDQLDEIAARATGTETTSVQPTPSGASGSVDRVRTSVVARLSGSPSRWPVRGAEKVSTGRRRRGDSPSSKAGAEPYNYACATGRNGRSDLPICHKISYRTGLPSITAGQSAMHICTPRMSDNARRRDPASCMTMRPPSSRRLPQTRHIGRGQDATARAVAR